MESLWVNIWRILYPFLCVLVPCIVYQIYAVRNRMNPKRRVSKRYLLWTYVFMLYLSVTLSVTEIGSIWDISYYDPVIRIKEINLIPFASENPMSYILNVILFIPLGFLLPYIWKRYRCFWKVTLTGLLLSLAIEVGQLFNRRCSDINDLLMNTLGAVIGYGIWVAFVKIFRKKKVVDFSLRTQETIAYIILAIVGRFFVYNWRWFIFS